MKIDIICPLYNAEEYILDLHHSILRQKDVEINNINYILTRSTDNTELILKENNISYSLIEPANFSHSRTREEYAFKSEGDILVFITQDIKINRCD
ncbi:MAG: glycosyltransferase family A protein, partial [Bacilli bacterium]|nr:glycosyltransferase family A protein [Bacilli bacterium]